MNNKEFISHLSARTGLSARQTERAVECLARELATRLADEGPVSVPGFGTFEVKKKLERVVVNPATRQRMLVPPRLALTFKPAATLKEKFK